MEEKRETAWGCATQNEAQRKRHCLFGEYQKKKKKKGKSSYMHTRTARGKKKELARGPKLEALPLSMLGLFRTRDSN